MKKKMMSLVIFAAFGVFNVAQASVLLKCRVTQILDNQVFGNTFDSKINSSLSISQDDFDGTTAKIGSNSYSNFDGGSIQAEPSTYGAYSISPVGELHSFFILITREDGLGNLKKINSDGASTTIAEIKCGQ